MTIIDMPLRTVSEMNTRGHWSERAYRAKQQRGVAGLACRTAARAAGLPAIVTMTRIAPRALDDDNLRSAIKALRDGIADAFDLKNDSDPRITWRYAQARGKPCEYAVRVEIEGAM